MTTSVAKLQLKTIPTKKPWEFDCCWLHLSKTTSEYGLKLYYAHCPCRCFCIRTHAHANRIFSNWKSQIKSCHHLISCETHMKAHWAIRYASPTSLRFSKSLVAWNTRETRSPKWPQQQMWMIPETAFKNQWNRSTIFSIFAQLKNRIFLSLDLFWVFFCQLLHCYPPLCNDLRCFFLCTWQQLPNFHEDPRNERPQSALLRCLVAGRRIWRLQVTGSHTFFIWWLLAVLHTQRWDQKSRAMFCCLLAMEFQVTMLFPKLYCNSQVVGMPDMTKNIETKENSGKGSKFWKQLGMLPSLKLT